MVVSRLQLRVCYSVLSQPLVTTAAIAKGKSYDWYRNDLSDASGARPFLPPFSPRATTLLRKWRWGSGLAMQGYLDASAIQTLKAETLSNHSIASGYVCRYTTDALLVHTVMLRDWYGRTSGVATGYGHTIAMGTGVLQLQLWAYYDCSYGRTTSSATANVLR